MLGSILWRAEQKESEPKYPLGLIEVKLKIVKPKIPKILEVKASGAPERKPKSARQQKNEKKKKKHERYFISKSFCILSRMRNLREVIRKRERSLIYCSATSTPNPSYSVAFKRLRKVE